MVSYGAAGVYGVVIAGPSLVALYFYHRVLEKSHRFAVISGKGYRPHAHDLGKFKYAALGFVVLYIMLAAIMPMSVLGWMSPIPLRPHAIHCRPIQSQLQQLRS